jgi:hypothetical protein
MVGCAQRSEAQKRPPSWDGQADPGTVFGSAYANELNNRPLFG